MHTNISLAKDGVNLFHAKDGQDGLAEIAHKFVTSILYYANDLCLLMNPSVNAYRRLDPKYEAPNEIKVSSVDRGSMVRIPFGNENSARIEVRTVSPDANPYLYIYALIKAGMEGVKAGEQELKAMKEVVNNAGKLPGEIHSALDSFKNSDFMSDVMGERNHEKYLKLKQSVANRSPRELGDNIKAGEVLYHHEVTNQQLWADF